MPAEELQKVKNQIAADAFRRLENPFFQLIQLLFYDGWGDWTYINTWADQTLAVTPEDVQRVARKYFAKENRTVATYLRKAGTAAEPVPEELAGLPPQLQQQVMAQIRQVRQVEDAAQLEQMLEQMAAQKAQVPPEFQKVLEILEGEARARLEVLQSAAEEEKP